MFLFVCFITLLRLTYNYLCSNGLRVWITTHHQYVSRQYCQNRKGSNQCETSLPKEIKFATNFMPGWYSRLNLVSKKIVQEGSSKDDYDYIKHTYEDISSRLICIRMSVLVTPTIMPLMFNVQGSGIK